jgi:hypothetical protein
MRCKSSRQRLLSDLCLAAQDQIRDGMGGGEVSELCESFGLEFLDFDYDSFIDELCLKLFYAEEFPAKLIQDTDKELADKKKELEGINAKQAAWIKQKGEVLLLPLSFAASASASWCSSQTQCLRRGAFELDFRQGTYDFMQGTTRLHTGHTCARLYCYAGAHDSRTNPDFAAGLRWARRSARRPRRQPTNSKWTSLTPEKRSKC